MLALRENALKNTTVPDSSWACGTDLMMVVVGSISSSCTVSSSSELYFLPRILP